MERISAMYVRVSTEEQAREGQSIENQVDRLSAYAKFQGWTNVQVFADEGESAKNMARPAMKRLVKMIKRGEVAVVATMAVDRLSRNLLDMLQFVELCEEHKTAYVCAGLNFDTSTPIGRMVLQILAAFAEFERSMIATRVRTTMQNIAEKKGRYMAVPPFGYALDEQKNLVPVPEQAEWVRRAADMFVAGHGYRAIAKYLNDSGVTTSRGAAWASDTVRGMLTNELYAGRLVYNRRYYDKAGKMHWRDPADWIVHEEAHPAIFSEEQWAEIDRRVSRKIPRGGTRSLKYRLSGFVRCGQCGAFMASRNYGNKGPHKDRKIFVCSNYQKSGSCTFNYMFVDELEAEVLGIIRGLAEESVEIPEADLLAAAAQRDEEFARRRAAIDQRFQRQIQAYENGLIDDEDLKIARERIQKERELLEDEKSRAARPDPQAVQKQLSQAAKRVLWLWESGELPVLHNTMRQILESVEVKDRKLVGFRLARDLISPE